MTFKFVAVKVFIIGKQLFWENKQISIAAQWIYVKYALGGCRAGKNILVSDQ